MINVDWSGDSATILSNIDSYASEHGLLVNNIITTLSINEVKAAYELLPSVDNLAERMFDIVRVCFHHAVNTGYTSHLEKIIDLIPVSCFDKVLEVYKMDQFSSYWLEEPQRKSSFLLTMRPLYDRLPRLAQPLSSKDTVEKTGEIFLPFVPATTSTSSKYRIAYTQELEDDITRSTIESQNGEAVQVEDVGQKDRNVEVSTRVRECWRAFWNLRKIFEDPSSELPKIISMQRELLAFSASNTKIQPENTSGSNRGIVTSTFQNKLNNAAAATTTITTANAFIPSHYSQGALFNSIEDLVQGMISVLAFLRDNPPQVSTTFNLSSSKKHTSSNAFGRSSHYSAPDISFHSDGDANVTKFEGEHEKMSENEHLIVHKDRKPNVPPAIPPPPLARLSLFLTQIGNCDFQHEFLFQLITFCSAVKTFFFLGVNSISNPSGSSVPVTTANNLNNIFTEDECRKCQMIAAHTTLIIHRLKRMKMELVRNATSAQIFNNTHHHQQQADSFNNDNTMLSNNKSSYNVSSNTKSNSSNMNNRQHQLQTKNDLSNLLSTTQSTLCRFTSSTQLSIDNIVGSPDHSILLPILMETETDLLWSLICKFHLNFIEVNQNVNSLTKSQQRETTATMRMISDCLKQIAMNAKQSKQFVFEAVAPKDENLKTLTFTNVESRKIHHPDQEGEDSFQTDSVSSFKTLDGVFDFIHNHSTFDEENEKLDNSQSKMRSFGGRKEKNSSLKLSRPYFAQVWDEKVENGSDRTFHQKLMARSKLLAERAMKEQKEGIETEYCVNGVEAARSMATRLAVLPCAARVARQVLDEYSFSTRQAAVVMRSMNALVEVACTSNAKEGDNVLHAVQSVTQEPYMNLESYLSTIGWVSDFIPLKAPPEERSVLFSTATSVSNVTGNLGSSGQDLARGDSTFETGRERFPRDGRNYHSTSSNFYNQQSSSFGVRGTNSGAGGVGVSGSATNDHRSQYSRGHGGMPQPSNSPVVRSVAYSGGASGKENNTLNQGGSRENGRGRVDIDDDRGDRRNNNRRGGRR